MTQGLTIVSKYLLRLNLSYMEAISRIHQMVSRGKRLKVLEKALV